MSKTLSMWYLTDISVFWIRHPVLPRNTHEYVLKKWDLSVPFLLSPLMPPGWPNTWQLCTTWNNCSLHSGHSCRQEDAQDAWGHVVTPKRWDTWVQTLLPHTPERTGNHPSLPDSLHAKYLSGLFSLLRREIKIPWAKEGQRNSAWRTWSLVPRWALLMQLHTKSLCESTCHYSGKMLYYRNYFFFLVL